MERMANLHTHSEYSNLRMLDCINKVPDLIDHAIQLNYTGLGLTDHESLSGHITAMNYVKEQKSKGNIPNDFKLVLGNEIYLIDEVIEHENGSKSSPTPYYHFILLAKDAEGNRQLRELSSMAWEQAYKTGKIWRVPTLKQYIESTVLQKRGHLIASTACLGGESAHLILNEQDPIPFYRWCKQIFGDDFYLEMQPSLQTDQIYYNQKIVQYAEELDIPFIITTDAHYLKKEDRSIHEAYLNSREDEEREMDEFYSSTYMMSADEIHQYLDDVIGAENVSRGLANSTKIADMCEEYSLNHKQIVPKVPIPEFRQEESFANAYDECPYIEKFAHSSDIRDRYFLQLIEDGWWEKEYRENLTKDEIKKMMHRIDEELEAIWETSIKLEDNVASYYITAREIVSMMWDDKGGNSLVGVSRGSVAAFYVAYLTDIQQINPMKYNIPSWRHLHQSRPEMPDVDIDTEASRRGSIIQATRNKFGQDRVLNICTFKTEGSKSSLLTAARGLGVDNDVAQYLANMIPVVRGFTTSLSVMVNGNPESGEKPQTEFINECNKYDGLLNTAMSIEGLVCGRSIHASGVIIFDDRYTKHNCLMKAPNGQPTTQWSMHDSEQCGGLKYDFLTITNLDAMRQCFDMLVEHGYLEWKGSLRKTFNYYFHPDVLDYESEEMWKMAADGKIVNLFQFMTQVGGQAIAKIQPKNLTELGVANAVMRLMAEGDDEQPLDRYVRYKNDINQWYATMKQYNLTPAEVHIIEKHLKGVSGMATMQEEVMRLVMDENISGFDMVEANKARKGIAKKNKKLQENIKQMFFKKGHELNTSDNLLNYVWNECVVPQLGYSFSLPHIIGYSTIAIQQMNMAYHYPIIYWNTANLIVDSGSLEENMGEDDTTNYGKIAIAIANMRDSGINVSLPLINEAKYQYVPDEKNNRIIYSLKSLCGIGDDAAKTIIEGQPYSSMEDFYARMIDTKLIKNAQMIVLIKAGAFTELDNPDREVTMRNYLFRYNFTPCEKLGMQQYNRLLELDRLSESGLIPEKLELSISMKNFKDYVLQDEFWVKNVVNKERKVPRCGYHDRWFRLDTHSMKFFKQHFTEESVVDVQDEFYVVSEKEFSKECDKRLEPFKQWLTTPETLKMYNNALFNQTYNKYAEGTIGKWEMDSLSFYYSEHELDNVNDYKYGVVNFFDLPKEPKPYDYYSRYINGEQMFFPKYEITRIAGTVVDRNNTRHTVTIITKDGVVHVKFGKGQFVFYNRRISQKVNPTSDKKTVLEESWFKRGTKVIISGYRQEDVFRAYKYNDSIYQHTCMKINQVFPDGDLLIQTERVKIDE